MSTFTAIGPALDIAAPLPARPRHALLNSEYIAPDGSYESVVRDRDATRVLNGVNLWPYPATCPSLWEPCSDGTFRVKDTGEMPATVRFDSFVVYQAIECSTISVGTDDTFFERINRVLEATASGGVERALAEGVDGSSNPFFGDANVDDLTGGTAVSPGVGLAMLEDAIGQTCRAGMIGATPGTIAALQAFPLGGDNMRLETANGTPVYSADGFIGIDTTALPAGGASEDYMIATGPIHVYLGPVRLDSIRENLDRSDNVVTFRAEMYVLALWDTALQAAALVDWST
jgi:hypothetical protein